MLCRSSASSSAVWCGVWWQMEGLCVWGCCNVCCLVQERGYRYFVALFCQDLGGSSSNPRKSHMYILFSMLVLIFIPTSFFCDLQDTRCTGLSEKITISPMCWLWAGSLAKFTSRHPHILSARWSTIGVRLCVCVWACACVCACGENVFVCRRREKENVLLS